MQDIRKPYTRSRSSRNLYSRVEQFESGDYHGDEDGTQDDRTDEPVRIPVRGARGRRDVNEMEMFPRHRPGGIDNHDDYEDEDGPQTKHKLISRDPRTRYASKRGSLGTWIFIAVVVALSIAAYLLTFVFNRATITVTPKYQDVETRKTVLLNSDKTGTGVAFIVATTSISSSKALKLSETKKIEAKASGKIIVYNKFDSQPQRLIKNTRFESAAGKIYRINDSVTVPGKKGDTPGSVEVTVYADSYGTDYNSAETDFTIPGFKGTPRFAGFFGRSSGAITGGSSGNVSLASLADINAAKDELALELGQKVKEKLIQVKKEGYDGLYSAVDIQYSDNEKDILQGKSSSYEVTATGYLLLADSAQLTRSIAEGIRGYANEPVRLGYGETLTYSIKNNTSVATTTSVEVLVEGTPRIIWSINTDELKKLFAGKERDQFKSIMSSVTSIEGGEIGFSPMWLSTFPSDVSKINVIEKLPKR